jgi:hypothetical protein
MSAFFVSIHHIDVIVSAAIDVGAYSGPPRIERVTRERATLVGAMLLRENLRSMLARYPRIAGTDEAEGYQATIDAYLHRYYPGVRPSAAAHAVSCYDYQSCEHPEYDRSQARAFVNSMRQELLRKLPGIDSESWGIDSLAQAQAATIHPSRLIRIG